MLTGTASDYGTDFESAQAYNLIRLGNLLNAELAVA
jgi:hypothetical protein